MDPFKIAVAVPTYKREELLRRLISSVPADWSVFVSDNAASLLPLTQPFDSRVRVSHAETLIPMFANWNRALSLVDDAFTHVLIPSDDDLFLPEAQGVVRDALAACPEGDIFIFGCDFVDEHDRITKGYCPDAMHAYAPGEGFRVFSRGVDARMPGVLIRKSFLDRIGAFDERFHLTAADSELIQRALLLGRSVFVPSVIGLYRIWEGSLTHARVASNQWMEEVDLWVEKIAGLLNAGHQPSGTPINVERFKDEIYMTNLRSGIRMLKRTGPYLAAWRHVLANRYPYRASAKSQVKLLAHLVLPTLSA